jgi:hypothetical protein
MEFGWRTAIVLEDRESTIRGTVRRWDDPACRLNNSTARAMDVLPGKTPPIVREEISRAHLLGLIT